MALSWSGLGSCIMGWGMRSRWLLPGLSIQTGVQAPDRSPVTPRAPGQSRTGAVGEPGQ